MNIAKCHLILNNVPGRELTPSDLDTLAYGIQLQSECITRLRSETLTLPYKPEEYIPALEALHTVLCRIDESTSCDVISILIEALNAPKPF